MSTENLQVEEDKSIITNPIANGQNKEDDKGSEKIVPVFQLTSDIESSLEELQKKMNKNEKDFMNAIEKIEKHINRMEK